MSGNDDSRWYVRHADALYKVVLVALLGLWVMFPPHAAQPKAAAEPQAIMKASTS